MRLRDYLAIAVTEFHPIAAGAIADLVEVPITTVWRLEAGAINEGVDIAITAVVSVLAGPDAVDPVEIAIALVGPPSQVESPRKLACPLH